MTTLFSVCIVVSLALDAAVLFASDRWRRRIAVALISVLVLVWIFLAVALLEIALRVESPLIPAAGVRRPGIVQSAGREALVVLASFGAPALLATLLGTMAIRGSRRRRPRPGYMERLK